MNLKGSRERYMERFGGRKGEEKCFIKIIIAKNRYFKRWRPNEVLGTGNRAK